VTPVRTTCPYCGVGCGVVANATPDGARISGDIQHPASEGRLCVKGSALGETLAADSRLLAPMRRDSDGDWQRCDWDSAMDTVAEGFARIIAEHGPDAVAFYVSGQLLTEDYYVANKLMKGFIGSANIDTNSRLCMSSAVAGHKRAFGEDLVPVCYEDLELADLVVLVGSNLAWCHPVLYQRLSRAKSRRPEMKVVVIDPRRTASCDIADLHLPLKPGSDVLLFNSLLHVLSSQGHADYSFVSAHTRGGDEALAEARASAADDVAVAAACGLQLDALHQFHALFARYERVVTVFSQGVNQSSSGTDKVNAIINCHLLTGRIGKPGAGPFSVTGQPNAMGGREVGGLANQLAAHMDIETAADRQRVGDFWQAPRMAERPGLKAVDLFDAMHEGRVKAIWIMATNPVVSLPDADRVRAALKRCELVVVSEVVARTDTSDCADVLLPAAGWGERDGTVTNSERCISRQRAFRPMPEEVRSDWWMICELARRLGHGEAFDYGGPAEIFDEHARLSVAGNDGGRIFRLDGLCGLTQEAYDNLQPVRWPVGTDGRGTDRLFADGRFAFADGRARLVPTAPRAPANAVDVEWPLVLNTGRVRDQWHTMSRTGLAPTLAAHRPEPFVDLHPEDALAAGVRIGDLARVRTRWGAVVVRATNSGDMRRGEIFVPIHWNGQVASDARVGALVNPVVDPISGEPEFKHTPARVEAFDLAWHGFAFTRHDLSTDDLDWWVRVQGAAFHRYELAGREAPAQPGDWARALLGVPADADWVAYADPAAGIYRGAWLREGRIEACVFLSPRADLPARNWLSDLFARPRLNASERAGLLAGEPPRGADAGPTVCACFGVGRNRILKAITDDGLDTAEAVTRQLKAGGNCGSCLPEIRALIAEHAVVPLNELS
jgi:assimilatory nitrate reductase catalytic subunit